MFPYHAKHLPGFGRQFKKQVRILQPGFVTLSGYGKVLARLENRVTVDPHHLDVYGIPIPVIQFRFGENERAMLKDINEDAQEILHAARSRFMFHMNSEPAVSPAMRPALPEWVAILKVSFESHCQAHDVNNLFVVDGSCFTTFPEKNPTIPSWLWQSGPPAIWQVRLGRVTCDASRMVSEPDMSRMASKFWFTPDLRMGLIGNERGSPGSSHDLIFISLTKTYLIFRNSAEGM